VNLESFERVIRSCCRHLGRDEVTIIGSQALFGSFDELPALFGELSRFHGTYGVYADPVEVSTSWIPPNWETRLVPRSVADPDRGKRYVARCVEPHDLCIAKVIAGRPKDRALLSRGPLTVPTRERSVAT
jgi:hypothetical protein